MSISTHVSWIIISLIWRVTTIIWRVFPSEASAKEHLFPYEQHLYCHTCCCGSCMTDSAKRESRIKFRYLNLVWPAQRAKRDWATSNRRRATEWDVPTCPPTKAHQNIKMKIKIKKQYKTPKRTAVGEASFPAPLKRSTIDQIYIYSYQNSFYYMNKG
jgi:hypothetical protein